MFYKDFEILKQRAEELLNEKGTEEKDSPAYSKNTYDLLSEFEKYQTELEIQNQDLLHSQKEMESSYHKYRELYEFAPAGYFTFSKEGIILDVNQTGANLLGVEKNSLINKGFSRYIAPEYQSAFYHHRRMVLEEKIAHSCELKLVKRKDALFNVLLHSKSIIDNDSKEERISSFITDINPFKQDELIFQNHQPKFHYHEGIDNLININPSISNEITRSLGFIEYYLNDCFKFLTSTNYTNTGLASRMKVTLSQINHTAEMISHLKDFAAKNELNCKPYCITSLIVEVMTSLQREIVNESLQFSFDPPVEVPLVLIDRMHIQQVILTLARSAIHWMIDNNTCEPTLVFSINHINARTLEISIIDNGPASTSEMLNNLFIQRFTTRDNQGGLSLALCRTIIEAHGGYLSVENNATSGGCFKFTLIAYMS